jgi:hypothetical protein
LTAVCVGSSQQRLVGLAQRVLQRVEDLGELEAQEALRVEAGDAVALVEAASSRR